MERGQIGRCPKDTLEVFLLMVQNKTKVFVDMTVECVGKNEPTIILVLSDRLQDVQNLLKHNISVNNAIVGKDNSIIHLPTVWAQRDELRKMSHCLTL